MEANRRLSIPSVNLIRTVNPVSAPGERVIAMAAADQHSKVAARPISRTRMVSVPEVEVDLHPVETVSD